MGLGYDKSTLTLAAATAQCLATLLIAEGYTGSMIGKFLELEDVNSLGDVYHGDNTSVGATTGRILTLYSRTSGSPQQAVDANGVFLFSTAGGDISCTFEPF